MVDFAKMLLKNAVLHIDFETRSVVDLKKHGLAVYAAHPSTEALMMGYRFNDGEIKLWMRGYVLPQEVIDHVKRGGRVIGHNIAFELAIWNDCMAPRHGWPLLNIEQCDCTMARAYAMSLPGALAKLAPALGIGAGKDMKGHALMMKMSKPRDMVDGKPIWWEDEDRMTRLGLYCKQDVLVESQCDERMVPLSAAERLIWIHDYVINQRGMGVDRDAIEKTQKLVDKVKKNLNVNMYEATQGVIKKTTEAGQILSWCQSRGVDILNLKKRELEDWLDDENLPHDVREVLEIRANGSKSSLSKLQTAIDMSLVDGRLRGMFQYHGASTGRFAARGVQLHNLPRPEESMEDPEIQRLIIDNIASGGDETLAEVLNGPFLRTIVSCIRGYLVAPDDADLIGADLANIEGRVLAWLAGEQWKLDAFSEFDAGTGSDLYKLAAQRIYNVKLEDVTKLQRLIGKVSELALGYQGAVGAFHSMAANYGVKVTDDEAQAIVDPWRVANKNIKNLWYKVGDAAYAAIEAPGAKIKVGVKGRECYFRVAGSFLWCQLPSGRVICYPYPEIQEIETRWGAKKMSVTYMGLDGRVGSPTKGKWVRMATYGGSLVENIVQAIARDILVGAWPRLEAAGYPIVLHVHDENVSEVPKGFGSVEEYERLMSVLPTWATGLPIAAAGFRGKRYRK